MKRRLVTLKLTDVSEVRIACIVITIALMMDAVRTSKTSVNFNVTTRHYIPEDFNLHTRRRENLKSHISMLIISTFLSLPPTEGLQSVCSS
jgi:hypothetical protein